MEQDTRDARQLGLRAGNAQRGEGFWSVPRSPALPAAAAPAAPASGPPRGCCERAARPPHGQEPAARCKQGRSASGEVSALLPQGSNEKGTRSPIAKSDGRHCSSSHHVTAATTWRRLAALRLASPAKHCRGRCTSAAGHAPDEFGVWSRAEMCGNSGCRCAAPSGAGAQPRGAKAVSCSVGHQAAQPSQHGLEAWRGVLNGGVVIWLSKKHALSMAGACLLPSACHR